MGANARAREGSKVLLLQLPIALPSRVGRRRGARRCQGRFAGTAGEEGLEGQPWLEPVGARE